MIPSCIAHFNISGIRKQHEDHLKNYLQPAKMDASEQPICLASTRVSLIADVTAWAMQTNDPQNVLWLHGLPGYGKSTVAATIAQRFRELNRLGAFILFRRETQASVGPSIVIRTIAFKLAQVIPDLSERVVAAIEADPSIAEANLIYQFKKLLAEPLTHTSLKWTDKTVLVIIDALDECGDAQGRSKLLGILARQLSSLPMQIRFLITSRPEDDINRAFSGQSLKEMNLPLSSEDVTRYVHIRVDAIVEKHGEDFLLELRKTKDELACLLALRASGHFIWASTALGFIENAYDAVTAVTAILTQGAGIDGLYTTAIETAGPWNDPRFKMDCLKILGAICVSRTPEMVTTWERLLHDPKGSIHRVLTHLSCVLLWGTAQPVRPLHASFLDYLTDHERSGRYPWHIDRETSHKNLASASFQTMKAYLRFNICSLKDSHVLNENDPELPARIRRRIPMELSFSSFSWGYHFTMSPEDSMLDQDLSQFLSEQFLFWLEVMSLLKNINGAKECIELALKTVLLLHTSKVL